MSSLKPEQQVVQHFTHIHPLTKFDGLGLFLCDGCKSYGWQTTYRCVCCDYDLHGYCATCPPTLLSFMHPQHELKLVFRKPDEMKQNSRICDICDELVEGLYYQCKTCGFDVHPLCTQLPQHVSGVSHPAHPLEWSDCGASSTCMVCRGAINSWRYKCGPCGVDVHMECVDSSAGTGMEQTSRDLGYTNQGQPQGQQWGRRARKAMFVILVSMTLGDYSGVIAGPLYNVLSRLFK